MNIRLLFDSVNVGRTENSVMWIENRGELWSDGRVNGEEGDEV